MKVAALISGGKDSCYNLMQCIAAGHTIEALANLCPKDVDELDSYMYQSVGHQGLSLYSEALGLPLYQREIEGTSLNTRSIYYTPTDGDEVEDLYSLLKKVKEECQIEAVSVGAIFSDYQRIRVENVCQRLNLVCLAYMWRRDQSELLQEIIDTGIEVVLVKVAAIGLVPKKHLGKSVREMQPYLHTLNKKYDLNVCGEGGEYETFTLDCPLFKKRIVIEDSEIIETPGDVGYLKFKSLKLVEKEKDESGSVEKESLSHIKMEDHLRDILELEGNPQIKIGHEFLSSEEVLENENEITSVEKSHSLRNECSWASSDASSVQEALSNIASHLKSRGRSLKDIVSITMLVKDMKNYSLYNKEYNQFFDINPPTRTCVQVSFNDDINVSLSATIFSAEKSDSEKFDTSYDPYEARSILHVQSISHWAPANIGPYSQAVKIGDLIVIAGMIGMIPMSLQIVNESVETQARLAYRHIGRILPVISTKATIKSVVQGICYVTKIEDIAKVKLLMEELNKFQICLYVVVPELPKSALVEWQIWAHIANTNFLYEETKFERSGFNVFFRQRSSRDGLVCSLIATISCNDFEVSKSEFEELVSYCIEKANKNSENKNISLTIYHCCPTISSSFISNSVINKSNVSTFVIPVLSIEDENTLLAIVLNKY